MRDQKCPGQITSNGPGNDILSLTVNGTSLYAGTRIMGLWKSPLSEINTAAKRGAENALSKFALQQNYPNPFNPTTTISFSLPSKSFISLKVFDIIGREEATIVSEEMSAGNYSKQ